ncbi:hypothetical protein [Streptomyces sp. URMC 123]|uniref:hypothetical protein n=1 Tax=Streptomyces sp. URMC 123 TaxID=3423403 RepID=UPI003F1C250A
MSVHDRDAGEIESDLFPEQLVRFVVGLIESVRSIGRPQMKYNWFVLTKSTYVVRA